MRSNGGRRRFRRILVFGLLSGCFITLVSIAVSGVFYAVSGWGALRLDWNTVYWLLAIFGLSSVSIIIAVIVYESFSAPSIRD
jgi:amino acid transporter